MENNTYEFILEAEYSTATVIRVTAPSPKEALFKYLNWLKSRDSKFLFWRTTLGIHSEYTFEDMMDIVDDVFTSLGWARILEVIEVKSSLYKTKFKYEDCEDGYYVINVDLADEPDNSDDKSAYDKGFVDGYKHGYEEGCKDGEQWANDNPPIRSNY